MSNETPEKRFWSFVDKTTACWLWLGGKDADGYGNFWVNGRTVHAHRYSMQLKLGRELFTHELVHHVLTCLNKACVCWDHLELTTLKDHPDGICHINSTKTQCPRGHTYDLRTWNGSYFVRECSICKRVNARERTRRYRQRKRDNKAPRSSTK